jgi:hypothetical protein
VIDEMARCSASAGRCIPDDPLFNESTFRPATPQEAGLQGVREAQGSGLEDALRDDWRADLLRIMVLSCASQLLRGRVLFYPTAIGWHPAEG